MHEGKEEGEEEGEEDMKWAPQRRRKYRNHLVFSKTTLRQSTHPAGRLLYLLCPLLSSI